MRVYVTGGVCVEADGAAVDETGLAGPKQVLVLAMLAVEHHRTVPRERLAELLWPNRLPPSWEGDLRSIVSRLRTALRPLDDELGRAIAAVPGGYRLDLGPDDWLDLDVAASAAHAAEAAAITRDHPRAATSAWVAATITGRGFLEHSDAAWAEQHRRRLSTIRQRSLESLSESLSALGEHHDAIRHAELAVEADVFRERSRRRLIEALVQAGDHSAAAIAFNEWKGLLAAELGIVPSPDTTSIYEKILAASRSSPRTRRMSPDI
jgi:DNA-binding SARP family transcriptional activator